MTEGVVTRRRRDRRDHPLREGTGGVTKRAKRVTRVTRARRKGIGVTSIGAVGAVGAVGAGGAAGAAGAAEVAGGMERNDDANNSRSDVSKREVRRSVQRQRTQAKQGQ